MTDVKPDSAETESLLEQARAGDARAFDRLFARHRQDLLGFVDLRLDRKLRTRLDPSDVVQEAQLEAVRKLSDYLHRRPMPFRLWLRKTTYERLLMIHRRHFKAAARDIEREVPLPDRSSLGLARQLLAPDSTPSRQLAASELARRVRSAVARLPDVDREILLMRTFEGASYDEVACVLDIKPEAAKKRHGRALLRLHQHLLESGLTESEL